MGEARFHYGYGSVLDVTEASVRDAFRRSIALDSAFSPAYIHLVELGYTLGGATEGRAATKAYLARDPAGQHAAGMRLLDALSDRRNDEGQRLLNTASAEVLFDGWMIELTVDRFLRNGVAPAARDVRSPSERSFGQGISRLARNSAAPQLAYRGRLAEAYITLGTSRRDFFAARANGSD